MQTDLEDARKSEEILKLKQRISILEEQNSSL